VMQALEEGMRADRAPYKILQFNDFGLVAITRKRVKQSLERTLCAPCSYCEGAGYIKSVPTVVSEILTEAQRMQKALAAETGTVMLRVNPEVARVLKSNQNTFLQELEEIVGRTVLVKSDPLLHQTKFDLA
jgi:ribonuclease G